MHPVLAVLGILSVVWLIIVVISILYYKIYSFFSVYFSVVFPIIYYEFQIIRAYSFGVFACFNYYSDLVYLNLNTLELSAITYHNIHLRI